MNASKQKKVDVVDEITASLQKAKALVVVEYTKLSVHDFQGLRKQLKAHQVTLKVYKNRLFKLAVKDTSFVELEKSLVGQNAFAFGFDDDIAPAKVLANFAKTHPALKLKVGIFENKFVNEVEVQKIAQYPSYEEALAMLANQLISPLKFVGKGLYQLTVENKLAG